MRFKLFLLFAFSVCLQKVQAQQTVYFNTLNSLHEMFGPPGLCAYRDGDPYCNQGIDPIFSIALHRDTLYMIGENNTLFSLKIGVPGSCKRVKFFSIITPDGNTCLKSLTVDKNGIIYAVDHNTTELYRYDPYKDIEANLGRINQLPGGDLMFYKNKLLLAARNNNIYEVNITNPPASTLYMSTGAYAFTGLISIPDGCDNNRYYGFSPNAPWTDLVELDLENRLVLGVTCQVPFDVQDGASVTENGSVSGVSYTSVKVQPPCLNSTTGSIMVQAYTPLASGITYWLDNTISNNTGIFTNVPEGPHVISIRNGLGCNKDSAVNILHGLSNISISSVDPQGCPAPGIPQGNITVSATSGYGPVNYILNEYWVEPGGVFPGLTGGFWRLSVRDASGCRFDTTIHLVMTDRPFFVRTIEGTPTGCDSKTGKITASLTPGTNAANVTLYIDNVLQPGLEATGLDAGTFLATLSYRVGISSCKFDTLITIRKFIDDEPTIGISTKDQFCLNNNGEVTLTIDGVSSPFMVNFNDQGFSPNRVYTGLAPGLYPIKIASRNYCIWDRTVEIKPFVVAPSSSSVLKTDPGCDQPSKVRVTTTGSEGPYNFTIAGNLYNSGQTVTDLPRGNYPVAIFNKDGCKVDTLTVTLGIGLGGGCEDVYVPKAFTPNGDGLNDILRPIFNPNLSDVHFRIFNRYGEQVFNGTGNFGWRGTFQNKMQPAGVYVWNFTYTKNGFRFSEQGTVLMIR